MISMFDARRTILTKTLLIVILLGVLVLVGCIGPRGWPGAQIYNNTLFTSTMTGKVLALNPARGTTEWEWEPQSQTGNTPTGMPQLGNISVGNITSSFLSCSKGGTGQFRSGHIYGTPAVANGTLYIGYHTGVIYAIDAENGVQIWDHDIKSGIAGGLTVANDTVFVGSSNGNLTALDAGNGSLKWYFSTQNEVWATPSVVDGVVYFGSLDHSLYALNAADGTEKWAFKAGGGITSTPLVINGVVYIGSFDKKFYAIDADTGIPKWTFEGAGGWFWSEAAYDSGTIYAGCLDHNVYALDATSGSPVWPQPFQSDSAVKSSPVIAGGVLVVASEYGKIYGVDLKTGENKWESDRINAKVLSPLCAAADTVYINSQDNRLYAFNSKTGREVWGVTLDN
jgi:outer membrane protein assembly factor BamB